MQDNAGLSHGSSLIDFFVVFVFLQTSLPLRAGDRLSEFRESQIRREEKHVSEAIIGLTTNGTKNDLAIKGFGLD